MTLEPLQATAQGGLGVSGGSGSPGTLINQGAAQAGGSADSPSFLTCDGADHTIAYITASPPSWLDGAGNIIAEGLYVVQVYFGVETAATTRGLRVWIETQQSAANGNVISLDIDACLLIQPRLSGLQLYAFPPMALTLAGGVLPTSTDLIVHMPTDATGQIQAFVGASQLASSIPT